MKCIAIDDEPMALEIIQDYVKKSPWLTLKQSFRNAIQGLEYMQQNPVDLLFLDIHMPDLSGIQLLQAMRNPPMVIFTTAHADYALESYELEAIDYLLKPIRFERFLKAVNKAQEKYQATEQTSMSSSFPKSPIHQAEEKQLLIKSGAQIHPVSVADIRYVEGAGNYLNYYLQEKKVMALQKMTEAIKVLPFQDFMRIHRSYIVARKYLTLIERHQVKIGEKVIPIGKQYRTSFFEWIEQERNTNEPSQNRTG